MIAVKDIPMLIGMAGTLLTGGFYIHDIKRDVTELDKSFRTHQLEQSIGSTSDRLYDTQQRIKDNPADQNLKREEQELADRKKRLQEQLDKVEGGKQ
jgi:uncharacterized protein HemX